MDFPFWEWSVQPEIQVKVERQSMKATRFRVSPLVDAIVPVLARKLEITRQDAQETVNHLIRSEQAGKLDHGLVRVEYLLASGKFGPYGGRAAPQPHLVAPGHLHVDGTGHLGYPVMQRLSKDACKIARKDGHCIASTKSVYPTGALGDWARSCANEGVATVLVASSPATVAAPGGLEPVVGTNPICVGIPASPHPFVADCAMSSMTHGQLLLHQKSGKPLPLHGAVGGDGRPASDPRDVDPSSGKGAFLSEGGSHKTFALAMAVELLVALGGGRPGQGSHGVFGLFISSTISDPSPLSRWFMELTEKGVRIPGFSSAERSFDDLLHGTIQLAPETMTSLARVLGNDLLSASIHEHPEWPRAQEMS